MAPYASATVSEDRMLHRSPSACSSLDDMETTTPTTTQSTSHHKTDRWRQLRQMVHVLTGLSSHKRGNPRAKDGEDKHEGDDCTMLILHPDFWLEAIDTRHRYGFHLRIFHELWKSEMNNSNNNVQDADRSFFHWLDHGKGSTLQVPECTRDQLNTTCVQYCSPSQRTQYLAQFQPKSPVLQFADSNQLVHTDGLSKWIFVLSQDKELYVARKRKGFFHHSSFLAGAPILAAGKIFVTDGRIHAVEPHSGHFKPRLENLLVLCEVLRAHDVDVSSVHIIRPRKWKDPWPFEVTEPEDDELDAVQSDSEYS